MLSESKLSSETLWPLQMHAILSQTLLTVLGLARMGSMLLGGHGAFHNVRSRSDVSSHTCFRFNPYMSWEASELWHADVEIVNWGQGPIMYTKNARRIAGDRNKTAVGEPNWINSTHLLFTSDEGGYFNPWIYDFETDSGRRLAPSLIEEDFGEPAFWRTSAPRFLLRCRC